ncbi:MAG: pitrilysin family protein [Dehalococcoidia bacterium]|nr:pitrilysin family protein [Dehalococcoidia bacterium]
MNEAPGQMYQKTTLPNGLRLVTSTFPHTRSVSVAIFVAAGPRYEKPELAGASHFIEHLCFKGTRRWPSSQQVSEAIEGVGGILNAGTDKEVTIYWCKVAQTHFQLALDLMTDLVRWPKMDPQDTERERPIIIEELNMCLDSPQSRVDQISDELLWPGQPLGRDIGGSKETVSAMPHQALLKYMAQRYLPHNAVVAVAGNIEHGQVEEAARKAFGDWKRRKSPEGFPSDRDQDAPRLRIEHRDTEQVNLSLGVRGIPALHADRFKVDLMNAVLGEGMSSRLFAEIREKRCLAYDIHSSVSHFSDTGALNVYAGVDPARLKDAIAAILVELDRLKIDMPETEVSKAKEMTKGRLLLRMEDTRNVVSWLGSQEIVTGKILTPDEVVAMVDQITAEDLKELAKQLLVTNKLSLAVVGPVKARDLPIRTLKL